MKFDGQPEDHLRTRVGAVVIGRNEGDRLIRCLKSLIHTVDHVVYVDSGSTDDSATHASALGVRVIDLDLDQPFTAARARNCGWRELDESNSGVDFIQFVDGDCELAPGWLSFAFGIIESMEECAIVCGRRRERFPSESVYNQLCDMEWDTPIGPAEYCGGDAMIRLKALRAVEGYRDSLIAGEEPDLCVRLRDANWTVFRMDEEMTLHDANILSLAQWWRRTVRSGHAFAEGHYVHRHRTPSHWKRETNSAIFWGGILPVNAVVLIPFTKGFSLLLLFLYSYLGYRVFRYAEGRWGRNRNSMFYTVFCVIGKIAEFQGIAQFHKNRTFGKQSALIEYK